MNSNQGKRGGYKGKQGSGGGSKYQGGKHQGGYKGKGDGKYQSGGGGKYTTSNSSKYEEQFIDKSSISKVNVTTVDVDKLPVVKNNPTNQYLSENKLPGKTGDKIILTANYFPLVLPKGPFFQYSIHFKPKVRKKFDQKV